MTDLWIPPPEPSGLLLPPGYEPRRLPAERDARLGRALATLATRVSASPWTTSETPFSALTAECERVRSSEVGRAVAAYVEDNPVLAEAAQMLFTAFTTATRARWQEGPAQHRGTAARGWYLCRWVPTFLIIDGPIGRFLRDGPLADVQDAPLLNGAKQLLHERAFKLLRNGFAHWSFGWEVEAGVSYVVVRGRKGQPPLVRLSQPEGDAFHEAAFSLVQILWAAFLTENQSLLEQSDDSKAAG